MMAASAAGMVASGPAQRLASYAHGKQFQSLAGATPFWELIDNMVWAAQRATKKQLTVNRRIPFAGATPRVRLRITHRNEHR